MMPPQQDAGIQTPEGPSAANPKNPKQKGGPINGGATVVASATAEHQAQRCPRCDSLNTKFCYYNNYSLSQPRHFCKNCRRYWTKGGALRNVPVGGGCRKNKRLKHRDPSCLATLADVDMSASSNLFSSMGIPGFGASTSSLIQELANEGQRLAFSQLNMQMLDKRFSTDNDHHHHRHPSTSTTQDFFAPPSLIGSFDHPASFPALSYTKGDPQSLLFQPHLGAELTPFFDPITSPTALTPTLENLSGFTTAAMAMNCATPLSSTSNMDAAHLSFMHHMPMNGLQASHAQQSAMQENAGGGNVVNHNHEREINPNMQDDIRMSRGKSILSSLSGRGRQMTGAAPNTNASDSCFYASPQVGNTGNDPNGLWSASWPEMHAALAGSAGAMLH